MNYRCSNSLLLLLCVAPACLACGVSVEEEDGRIVWFTETLPRQSERQKYYAGVFENADFQLTSANDLAKGRALGQDRDKRSELPDAHGVLYVLTSPESIAALDAYQVVVRKPDTSKKGASPYGKELSAAFMNFREAAHGTNVCRWQW